MTRPFMPSLPELIPLLEGIWERGWVTNDGPVLGRFEAALQQILGWHNVAATANGTLALQLACRALRLEGEVVTAAFTFPATTQALRWNGLVPVMADVEPAHLTLDPAAVSAAVTSRTSAVLAVHTFGHPADVEGLQKVADRHGLALLYDAAPAVGVRVGGAPVTAFGDASAVSFHATKVMHTLEGGAVCTRHPEVAGAVRRLRNFGLAWAGDALEYGTNAKLNELQSAVGLLVLNALGGEISRRAVAMEVYGRLLAGIPEVHLMRPAHGVHSNHAYAVVRLRSGGHPLADRVHTHLLRNGVNSKRYFGPGYRAGGTVMREATPVADSAAEDVLCLPLWGAIPRSALGRIAELVGEAVA
ncbi:DegT/DnrJ/EryC1/StrS family aminotransferase [Streptomyces sp. NPDC019443]|uniref:DegT/DnrJ/EryC1/StrS family aminotransferase n=1 Tax=Streptomyces sp. NPDC019443 TaxID=3365061 RepID=UPI00379507D1